MFGEYYLLHLWKQAGITMGKISVKYYLNKGVKPIQQKSLGGELVELYPLYYYITIRRKTIHKPSKLKFYLSEASFIDGMAVQDKRVPYIELSPNGKQLQGMLDYETNLIKGIAEIYEKDYTEGNVKVAYQNLAQRGFNSKDAYTNNLNAYIEFYTEPVKSLAHRNALAVSRELFVKNISDIRKSLGRFAGIVGIQPTQDISDDTIAFYEKAYNYEAVKDLYAYYLIALYETNTSNQTIRQLGLSVYEWIFGEGKKWVWDNIRGEQVKTKKRDRNTQLEKLLTLTEEEYQSELVSIIDFVCSGADRVEKAYKEMKAGI